jgi:multidrug efflux pump subunit AcrB
VLALVHVPLMANRRLFPKVEENPGGERVYEGRTYEYLRRMLVFGLKHRWGAVVTMLILLALTGFGYRFVRQGFFPDMEYDQLYMEYKLPEGSN